VEIFRCRHRWGFPRRWPEFEGQTDVDVQTCSKCGAHRLSPIQFGQAKPSAAPVPSKQQSKQRFFKWMHSNS
jgi:hypothetical protein